MDKAQFIPKLTTYNWAEEWIELQKFRRVADDSAYWDERSKTFNKPSTPNDYVKRFLELADIQSGETVFDMGCGTGALTIPLAKAGHDVIAADFSQGMLGIMKEECARAGLTNVKPIIMSWADDWEKCGVAEKSADVAIASRSIVTADLKDSLEKLSRVARRRACITLPTGTSPRADERVLNAIGIDRALGRDFVYAYMILCQMGYFPEVSYIPSKRKESFADCNAAYQKLSQMVIDVTSERLSQEEIDTALERLRAWLPENLIENPHAGELIADNEVEEALILNIPRKITWAFIAWNVEEKRAAQYSTG